MRFSITFVSLCALTAVGGCSFVIPPEQNAPRNNIVEGGVRKPALNNRMSPQSSVRRMEGESSVAQLVMPPAEPQVQARAAQEMSMSLPSGMRQVPVENQQFEMSASGYPPLDAVPSRPVTMGEESSKSRLVETQSALERDIHQAKASKENLARDAAAEPSMLSELPKTEGVVPPNDPINAVPMVAPQPLPPLPAVKPEAAIEAKPVAHIPQKLGPVEGMSTQPVVAYTPPALPPAPRFAPPVPLGKIAKDEAAPLSRGGDVIAWAPVAPAVVASSQPYVRAGDFDPLAIADDSPVAKALTRGAYVPPPTALANRFIAPSRYLER